MVEYIEREAAYNAIVKNYDTDEQLRDLCAIPAADVRLGDLDELYASLKKWLIQNRHSMTEATRVWIRGVLEGIAAAPTIIPSSGGIEDE